MVKDIWKLIISFAFVILISTHSWAWSSKTHIFISQEAGIKYPEASCFPDLSKKDNNVLLGPFHWHGPSPNTIVTPDYIDRFQITEGQYVKVGSPESKPIKIKVPDPAGVLYWKIMELYQAMKGATGWEYEYYLTNIAHYVGDLSQPLHNFPYGNEPASDGKSYPEVGTWAKEHHLEFDDILESSFPLDKNKEEKFRAMINPPQIKTIDDLKKEISKVANSSITLAKKCYYEKRIITQDEALKQAALSVSLLKAIIESTKK
jgi:hypothetical protein